MKTVILSCIFLLMLCSCESNRRDATFHVVNNSRFIKDVNIELSVGGKPIVNQKFTYTGVTPNYSTFEKSYTKGIYSIKVDAGSVARSDTFNLSNDIYIYISYDAVVQENGDTAQSFAIYKTYTRYEQH